MTSLARVGRLTTPWAPCLALLLSQACATPDPAADALPASEPSEAEPAAATDDPITLEHAEYLVARGGWLRAERVIAQLVAANQNDVEAWLLLREIPSERDGRATGHATRAKAWQQRQKRDPDDPLARFVLASNLLDGSDTSAEACQQAEALLEPIAEHRSFGWAVNELRRVARRPCEGDFFRARADDSAPPPSGRAERAAQLQAALRASDDELIELVQSMAADHPAELSAFARQLLWPMGEATVQQLLDAQSDGATGVDPTRADDRTASADDATTSADDRTASADDATASADDRTASADDPSASADDRTASADDATASADDPSGEPSADTEVAEVAEVAEDSPASKAEKRARTLLPVMRDAAERLWSSSAAADRWAALQILSCTADSTAARWADELTAEDPHLPKPVTADCFINILMEGRATPHHDEAINGLMAVSDLLPSRGQVRDRWKTMVSARLKAMQRPDLLEPQLRAWAEDPFASADDVNTWAWRVALNSDDEATLRSALGAIDAAITGMLHPPPATHRLANGPQRGPISGISAYLDTRAWLHYRLGEHEAALADMQRVLSYGPHDHEVEAHMGLILHALGDVDAALPWLLAAVRGDLGASTGNLHDAVVAALRASPNPPIAHPDGLEGWLRDLAGDASGADDGPEGSDHPLLGKPCPVMEFTTLDGEALLVGQGKPTVINLWATWCGPCVEGLPDFDEVAAAWSDREVQFVGASADYNQAAMRRFFQRSRPPSYQVAYLGIAGMKAFEVTGIPAAFVVDAEGKVLRYFRGHYTGDSRVQDTLEALFTEG